MRGLHLNDALRGELLQTNQVEQILSVSCGWSVVARYLDQKKKYAAFPGVVKFRLWLDGRRPWHKPTAAEMWKAATLNDEAD